VETHKFRRGEDDKRIARREHAALSPAERIGRSWEITQALYRIRGIDVSTKRLERSITTIQRRGRLEKAAEMQDSEKSLPDDVSAALAAYRKEKTAARWTALSQLWVGEVQVLDALKLAVPDFPDPLPLPVDGLLDDSSEFFEWSALPDPDDVRRGLRIALSLP
jgi:hypothetical protein